MDLLPFQIEPGIRRVLGTDVPVLSVLAGPAGASPRLRGQLPRPASGPAFFVIRVHTRTGIPVATVPVHVSRGDRAFETDGLTFLAMEGYAHLSRADSIAVKDRVWSRRAYATGAQVAGGIDPATETGDSC